MYKMKRVLGWVGVGVDVDDEDEDGALPKKDYLSSSNYMEMDPSGRYGRFREILGKGAMKIVYKAFDEILGVEVAWNQVILHDVFRSPDELQRLYSEVHLLKNLDHHSIMKFHTSWIDTNRRTFNFITEMFTSGTLREYRQRYKRVDIRAVKNWARQILEGLAYLHGHDPPVIHRDLKCDNIFVNGHLGQVKIGDLGLAATLRESQHAHSVIGTPEFMAPELYEEDYDELVDIYSFGMCVLEMLTCDYPYRECSNPAQIYKKVTSGKLPAAFYRIEDVEARRFVGKCLENASKRPSASELLMDPFLSLSLADLDHPLPVVPLPITKIPSNSTTRKPTPNEKIQVEMPPLLADPTRNTDMTITGTMNPEDDTIFLKVQISDDNGKSRNIYFPFDTVSDTALDVAMEMVKELDITDRDPFDIAEMIDDEISALVPTWKDCDSPDQNLHDQHGFKYDYDDDDDNDDDDNENRTHYPFYSLSAAFYTSCGTTQSRHRDTSALNWSQDDDFVNNEDASSQSSLNSYSNINYCSSSNENVDDVVEQLSFKKGVDPTTLLDKRRNKCTRFCPEDSHSHTACNRNRNQQRKIARIGSLVDVRSQLLHKSLVEEIYKRRLFNTVGAVENIGYHEPW